MIVPDEEVIEALLKDAKRFKSKWELHTGEPTRSKPNIKFLKRTLSNVVKTNEDRMRKPKDLESSERDFCSSSSSRNNRSESISESEESGKGEKCSRSRHESRSRHHSKRSKNCSKSKYRSPESRNRSSKRSSREKRSSSNSKKRRKK